MWGLTSVSSELTNAARWALASSSKTHYPRRAKCSKFGFSTLLRKNRWLGKTTRGERSLKYKWLSPSVLGLLLLFRIQMKCL
ncbi:hypothetical protein TNIN_471841 [Trichonephila inaurata madagascariensis]|uniref:Uncharacterized protein n=1 Tax=Trichonephila inaurata madagascariensis TaxID=2747483 RepID=A0A8X6IDK4_9ARAC|nr:hypothetical protein TNIN_471841 [Trichonephila inaurata madagascariensis]